MTRNLLRTLVTTLAVLQVLGGCTTATLDKMATPAEAGYALAPATSGKLADIARAIQSEHGEEYSGFKVPDSSFDGLQWRLALVDSATTSLDIQTYLWYPDLSGRLVPERAVQAAQRGVKVRLIVDDLILRGYDQLIANLDAANGKGKLTWHSGDEVLGKQPAREGMQRVMNVLMKVGPKDQY